MVNIYDIFNKIIKGCNSINPNYTFIKANQEGNLPSYPYITINCITPYKRDKDDIRGTITQDNSTGDNTKVKLNRTETPKMIFSFSAYSTKEIECLAVIKDTIDYLTFLGLQYLNSCGIVVIECSTIVNKTNWLEVDYQYQWGFDLTIRVKDTVSINIDTVDTIELTDKVDNKTIEI